MEGFTNNTLPNSFELKDNSNKSKGQQAITKAQEVVDLLGSLLSSREMTSQLGIEPPTSSLRFGYLSIIIE